MKHHLLILLTLIGSLSLLPSSRLHADQCDLMSLEKAEAACSYFLRNTDVVLWCACCDNDAKTYLKVQKAYPHEAYDMYEVVLEGLDAEGQEQVTTVDLAYVHAIRKGKAYCAGAALHCNPDLDPCTKPFSFKVPEVKVAAKPQWNFGEMSISARDPEPAPYKELVFPRSSDKPDYTITTPGRWATHVRFSRDDRHMIVGGGYFDDENSLQVFSTTSFSEERRLVGLKGMVISMDVSSSADLLAASDNSGKVVVWDFITGEKKYEITEHHDWVEGLAFSPDGKYFATAGRDKKVCVWESATGRMMRRFVVKMETASAVAISGNNGLLAVGGISPADEIKMISLETGQELFSVDHISRWCKDLAFAPGDLYLLAATECDNTALVIDPSAGDIVSTIGTSGGCTEAVDIDASRRYIAVAAMWGISVYHAASGESLFSAHTHEFPVEDICFSHNGKWLATAARGSEVHVWKLRTE